MKLHSPLKISLAGLLALLLGGCGSIVPRKDSAPPIAMTPVAIAQLGDAKYWLTINPITYRETKSGMEVIVPKGFITDLASIPRELWFALSPIDKYMNAAILHDYLYWDQRCDREDIDVIFYSAMRSYAVTSNQRHAVFDGVHYFGDSSFSENRDRRKSGELRFIKEDFLNNWLSSFSDSALTLEALRSSHSDAFVEDHSNPKIVEFCRVASNWSPNPVQGALRDEAAHRP